MIDTFTQDTKYNTKKIVNKRQNNILRLLWFGLGLALLVDFRIIKKEVLIYESYLKYYLISLLTSIL